MKVNSYRCLPHNEMKHKNITKVKEKKIISGRKYDKLKVQLA